MKVISSFIFLLILFYSEFAAAGSSIEYHKIKLQGWEVNIEKSLVKQSDKRVFKALRILKQKLLEISESLPEHHVDSLKTVPLWISRNNGTDAEYYFYERRVFRSGINPKMLGGIEFKNISIFLAMVNTMPGLVIHELAHAYHRINYERIDKLVMRAFKHAQQENLYRSVNVKRNHKGKSVYASKNAYEYFADLSAMYFGRNDYYPYNRDDLTKHDPKGYEMIEEVWK